MDHDQDHDDLLRALGRFPPLFSLPQNKENGLTACFVKGDYGG